MPLKQQIMCILQFQKATTPVVSLLTIVAFIIHIQPLSSPLLLRNPPNTFAFIPIPPMSLSSRNRSNSKAFRHILPCITPVCEGMHYHKTGVPWQTNKTLIITIPSLLSTYFSSAFPNISNSFIASISFASSSLPFAEYGL